MELISGLFFTTAAVFLLAVSFDYEKERMVNYPLTFISFVLGLMGLARLNSAYAGVEGDGFRTTAVLLTYLLIMTSVGVWGFIRICRREKEKEQCEQSADKLNREMWEDLARK